MAKAAGKGNENVTQDDITVPVLVLVQANSPQTIKKSDAYIVDCSAGDMINSLTRENYGDELYFIPITYRRTFREHAARTTERLGDYIAEHLAFDMASLEQNEKGFPCLVPDTGHEIVQTGNDLVMLLPEAKLTKGKITFSGELEAIMIRSRFTKWRMAKQLNSLCKRLTLAVGDRKVEAPRFAGCYRLASEYVDDGENSYYNWSVSFIDWNSEAEYNEAEAFYDSIVSKVVHTVGDDEDISKGGDENY